MSKEDDVPKLRIDARVVRQLGSELITDPEQALLELVKNSYDADADRCRIEIDTEIEIRLKNSKRVDEGLGEPELALDVTETTETLKGRITVEDDGPGASLEDIFERWLLISGSEKRADVGRAKALTKKGRTPLGDKGIGRLGTGRLGDCVQFISRPRRTSEEAKGVEFRWSEFDSFHTLDEVPVRQVVGLPNKGYSTRVMIEGLEEPDHWLEQDTELQARVSKLISPFTNKHPLKVSITINGRELELQRLAHDLELYGTARHDFSFERQADGRDFLTLTSEISSEFFGDKWRPELAAQFYKFVTEKNPSFGLKGLEGKTQSLRWLYRITRKLDCSSIKSFDAKNHPGNFSGRIYSISFSALPSVGDETSASGSGLTPPSGSLAALFKKLAGVSIFRDGFGVRIDPDWLEMSAGVTSGGSWYGLRRTNTIGHIDISTQGNAVLVEKSDREGFIDTPAYRQFLLIAKKVRDEINDVYEVLRRGHNSSLKNKTSHEGPATPEGAIKTLAQDAKFARDFYGTLAVQKTMLERASKLADQVKGPAGKDAQLFKVEAARALKTIGSLSKKSISAKSEDAAELLSDEIKTLRSQIRTAYDFIAAGMAAETLAHEVHPLLDLASELIRSAERATRKSGLDRATTDLQGARSYVRLVGKQLSMLNPMLKVYRETKDIIEIGDFMADYRNYIVRRLEENQIELKINSLGPFSVEIPRGRLMQVVDNLVRNSEYWLSVPQAKKSIAKRQITIEIAKPYVSISDNGFGIRPEIEDRIFAMFVSDKPKESGRGLGLFITREILLRYGCDIMLSEFRNAHGRRFRFDLDLSAIAR